MEKFKHDSLVGKTIEIIEMDGEPSYSGKIGEVLYEDDIGQLHGTWGGLAIDLKIDIIRIL